MLLKHLPGESLRYPPTGQLVPEEGLEVADSDPQAAWLIEHGCAVDATPVVTAPAQTLLKGDK